MLQAASDTRRVYLQGGYVVTKVKHTTWVMKLPRGLREQPGWVFIGTLSFLSGLSYMLGISESTITQVINERWLQVWGGFMGLAGVLVVIGTVTVYRPLERLALRFLSLGLLMYMGWILVAVPFEKATIVIGMCISLIALSEIRAAVIKSILRPLPPTTRNL